jgi:hypothetical protein
MNQKTVSNLSPGRAYEFMVLSQDRHGDGMFSKAIRISTKGTSVILSVELVNSYVT